MSGYRRRRRSRSASLVAVIVLAAAALFLGKDAVIALGVICVIVFLAVNWFIN